MAVGADFLAHAEDLFGGLGRITTKRMFGGVGLYLGDVIFAIAIDEVLYLKTDAETRPRFEAAGATPFVYDNPARGPVATSYWSLPDEASDDPDAAQAWARLALEAALRKPVGKKRKR
jgi:DNA transformation protein